MLQFLLFFDVPGSYLFRILLYIFYRFSTSFLFHVKNSYEVVSTLREEYGPDIRLPKNFVLSSINLTSTYSKVPIEKSLAIVRELWYIPWMHHDRGCHRRSETIRFFLIRILSRTYYSNFYRISYSSSIFSMTFYRIFLFIWFFILF